MTYAVAYILFVIGGKLNLRPAQIKPDWTVVYRLPTNIFFATDRLLNALLCGEIDETISSRVGRLHPGSWLHWAIDIFALDWPRHGRPGHCRKYLGY